MIPIKTSTIKNPLGMPSKLNIDPCQFDTNFKLIIATTPDEKERAFLLRHHVFNEELNYNIGDKTSSTVEKDSHDTHSLLCLLQHRESGMDVGCLRVVFIDEAMNSFSKKLPFEEYCKNSLTNPKLHPKNLPQDTICEVSRLAVHPLFRKKKSTIESNICNTENTHQKNESLNQSIISLSLFLAATALVGLARISHRG